MLKITRAARSLAREFSKQIRAKWRSQTHEIVMLDAFAIRCSLAAEAAANNRFENRNL